MTALNMNTLITTIVCLAFLATSYASYSQTDVETDANVQTLESEYQKELDRWMLQAYEGDRDAQFKVGVLFTNDQFKSADFEQSAYWYKQAARQGHALAQYNLGHQYLTGNGVKRSETEAMKWWLKAAEQDHPLAQFNVARAYYLGIGLREDHSQSRLWFRRAAKNNEPKSIDILQQLGWSEPGEYQNTTSQGAPEHQVSSKLSELQTSPPSEPTTVDQESSIEEPANQETSISSASQVSSNPIQARGNNPIAVYTNPAKRSVLIAVLDLREELSAVSADSEWTEVTSENGFPVWVHRDYIEVSDNIGTVQGNAVNARSVPLITNGTVVGKLNDNETLVVLDKKDQWYRVKSPNRFKAWVKTEEFNRKEPTKQEDQDPLTTDSVVQEQPVKAVQTRSAPENSDDNDWLFRQPADSYTLQLASLDDPAKVAAFKSRKKFQNNPNLRSFSSTSKDIVWTYFLYGAFDSSELAKQARSEIQQKLAWVRTFGRLQQNRCVAWKKQIPTPKELNKYCT